ncbi:MAG: RnfABCDGE type electron transport complex subunit D [Eubacterium sp.]|nr:RnfABCDGE type electron transport complex subunit D [Eubacterium sp.]
MEKKYYNNLIVSSSPHHVNNEDTQRIMAMVIAALIPSLCVATYVFGPRVLALTAVCVVSSVVLEFLWNKLVGRPQTVTDLSAALTGLLIAFNVPSNLPFYIAIIGCAVAIILVKGLFGGLGHNLFNPAITARVVLFIAFATQMTTWPVPRKYDGTTGATPLGILNEGGTDLPTNMDMFLGFCGGSMGEVSAVALLIGGLFLIWKKVISPIIPVCFIATVFVIGFIATGSLDMAIFHIFAGGVMLGAFFMATDYVTTPLLPLGKIIFGVGCGIITMLIRLFGAYPEGVSFAILLMNILTPHIDTFCTNRLYPAKKGGAK